MAPIDFPAEGIDDGVVRLRLRSEADLPAVVQACRDPEIPHWTLVPDDYTLELAAQFAREAEDERASGIGLHLLVVDAREDRLLGSLGIVAMNHEEGRCELGYWLAKEARGRGTMSRAVVLLSRWTFKTLPIERIEILSEPENRASCAVAARAGFRLEGVLRSYFSTKGRRGDAASYSLLRGELPQNG